MPIYTQPPTPSPLWMRATVFACKCIVAAGFVFGLMAIVAVIGLSLE